MLRKTARGFTLVELLIVIALIGVLAVAVLAAINPLEQLNRARDTGMESDASQLLAAIDRYYASQEEFPWMTVDALAGGTTYDSADDPLLIMSARNPFVGLCETDLACETGGPLITQFELKTEFVNRRFITDAGTDPMRELYLGKAQGASSSVYACWIPQSEAARNNATHLVTAIPSDAETCDPEATGAFADFDSSCFICIPR